MAANTSRRVGSTLPPCSTSPGLVEDGRKRSCSESQQLVPEPFQSIPAQELLKDSHCRKCGWIRKEGGSLKTWRDRYFILHKGCLYYYNRPEATTTAGKFSLGGYRLSPAPEKSSKFQWTFKLVHLQPEKRTYYFAAYSEKEMTEWMECINADMNEYCGTGRQTIIEPSTDSGEEYCYPEVEPKFDMEQLAALFGKCPFPSSRETGGSEQPTSGPMYCPPPEIDPRDIPRKSPRLHRPPSPPKAGLGRQKMGFSYMTGNRISAGPPSLRPMRQPSPGSSPIFKRKPDLPPDVPSRHRKPLAPPKPQSRPPPPTKRATAPTLTYPSCILNSEDDEDEEGEGYLDIVPDTNPEDLANEVNRPTLSRSVQGFPDGQSFRKHHSEDVLPPSALQLDVDKQDLHNLLENKLGVYIMRESQNAQSKRALAVWTGEKVRHYMLFYDKNLGYALDPEGERFADMKNLLRHYYKFNLPKCDVKLTRPYK